MEVGGAEEEGRDPVGGDLADEGILEGVGAAAGESNADGKGE